MEMNLSWVVVSDLEKALDFYINVVGLELKEKHEAFGWAEVQGEGGSRLGIAQTSDQEPMPVGSNAVVCMSVKDIDQSKASMSEKGCEMVGDILEIPGMVKLQTFKDADGNHFQLAQQL